MDLSHAGAVVSPELGLRNAQAIARAAQEAGTSIMVSAESSDRTELVLDLYERIARRALPMSRLFFPIHFQRRRVAYRDSHGTLTVGQWGKVLADRAVAPGVAAVSRFSTGVVILSIDSRMSSPYESGDSADERPRAASKNPSR